MSNSIAESFKTGHKSMLVSIDQVQILTHSYSAAKPAIREIHKRLWMHFGRQNKEFFDSLKKAYSPYNKEALKIIEFLIHDLKSVQVKHFIFFEKHSGEMSNLHARSFLSDFNEFARAIVTRIEIEEEYMLPLIEKSPKSLKKPENLS